MVSYRVQAPEEPDEGIRIECEAHGEGKTFEIGYRKVAFHCDECGIEIEVKIGDTEDWRELTELC